MNPGRFITLEGGEGAGKSTLAFGLTAALRARGLEVIQTREPGGSEGADAIRSLLVQGAADRWSPTAEALLFAAARSDHLDRLIRPALARGAWVVCDRYTDSTFAYQVVAGGLPQDVFETLQGIIDAPRPDLTLVLDLTPDAGLARSRGAALDEDRFEQKTAEFHARVRAAFLDIAQREQRRCVIIDASQTKDAALAAALEAVDDRLK
ncbi:MAG: dTMP kinase [Caulobacterales bacterium]